MDLEDNADDRFAFLSDGCGINSSPDERAVRMNQNADSVFQGIAFVFFTFYWILKLWDQKLIKKTAVSVQHIEYD